MQNYDQKGPAGPSGPLRQVYNQLPFVTMPFISLTKNTKMARGMIVPVTVAANTTIVITHSLGRLMQGATGISNGANGELYPPRILRVVGGTRTTKQQSIQCDTACTSALIWVF